MDSHSGSAGFHLPAPSGFLLPACLPAVFCLPRLLPAWFCWVCLTTWILLPACWVPAWVTRSFWMPPYSPYLQFYLGGWFCVLWFYVHSVLDYGSAMVHLCLPLGSSIPRFPAWVHATLHSTPAGLPPAGHALASRLHYHRLLPGFLPGSWSSAVLLSACLQCTGIPFHLCLLPAWVCHHHHGCLPVPGLAHFRLDSPACLLPPTGSSSHQFRSFVCSAAAFSCSLPPLPAFLQRCIVFCQVGPAVVYRGFTQFGFVCCLPAFTRLLRYEPACCCVVLPVAGFCLPAVAVGLGSGSCLVCGFCHCLVSAVPACPACLPGLCLPPSADCRFHLPAVAVLPPCLGACHPPACGWVWVPLPFCLLHVPPAVFCHRSFCACRLPFHPPAPAILPACVPPVATCIPGVCHHRSATALPVLPARCIPPCTCLTPALPACLCHLQYTLPHTLPGCLGGHSVWNPPPTISITTILWVGVGIIPFHYYHLPAQDCAPLIPLPGCSLVFCVGACRLGHCLCLPFCTAVPVACRSCRSVHTACLGACFLPSSVTLPACRLCLPGCLPHLGACRFCHLLGHCRGSPYILSHSYIHSLPVPFIHSYHSVPVLPSTGHSIHSYLTTIHLMTTCVTCLPAVALPACGFAWVTCRCVSPVPCGAGACLDYPRTCLPVCSFLAFTFTIPHHLGTVPATTCTVTLPRLAVPCRSCRLGHPPTSTCR